MSAPPTPGGQTLLAVDLGLRAGMALYGRDGRLRWYRSTNFGSLPRLRRGAPSVVGACEDLAWIALEGDRALGDVWVRAVQGRGARALRLSAETWREALLLPRQQEGRSRAKREAGELARRVIAWSGARRPTSLRHDAAEAILVGIWAVVHVGWLPALPSF